MKQLDPKNASLAAAAPLDPGSPVVAPETPPVESRARGIVRGVAAAARDLPRRCWTTARVLAEPRALRALAPAIVPLTLLPFLIPTVQLEINEPLFGDTAVYQYTGWGIRHGMRLYQDMGMADGPFIHYFHAAMQMFVGLSDRGFRAGDIVLQILVSGLIGALLAPPVELPRVARAAQRLAWFGLAAAVWLSWYLTLDWYETTEREAYYTLFGLLGMVLLYTGATSPRRGAALATFVGGFLVTSQVFGKPTGLGYVVLGALSVLVDNEAPLETRRLRRKMFGAGAVGCMVALAIAFLVSGSFRGYFLWCIRIPYRGNSFLFHTDWLRLWLVAWDPFRVIAMLSLIAGVAAIAVGLIPRRAIGLVMVPPLFFLGACLQAKGFNYHNIPVVSGAYTLALLLLSRLWGESSRPRWVSQRALWAVLALTFLGSQSFDNVHKSPYRWNGDRARWTTPAHEFAPEERQVGRYLKAHTNPSDTVFALTATQNAHVLLFYAERRSASPFFHDFWLDPVGLLGMSEVKPNPRQLAALEAVQATVRGIACGAVRDKPPAAMAFNRLEQVFKICPEVKGMLETQYQQATTIGTFRIYFKKPPAA